jgi:hypothetical protein
MSCADVCLFDGYEFDGSATLYRKATRTARKDHECEECPETILAGERYEWATGCYDGEFQVFKTCSVCVEIRTAFTCGSWVHGNLWESIQEEMFPEWKRSGEWDCLAKLKTQRAIDAMNRRYRWWLGEDDQ